MLYFSVFCKKKLETRAKKTIFTLKKTNYARCF